MKHRLLIAVALLLTLCLCACGAQEDPADKTSLSSDDTTLSTPDTGTTDAPDTTDTQPEVIPLANIRAILTYTHNAYGQSGGHYGYTFQYYTSTEYVSGSTKKTPIVTEDPLSTPNLENLERTAVTEETFDALCEAIWDKKVYTLPTYTPVDQQYVIMDGSDYYLLVFYESGSVKRSSGYCATSYHSGFSEVWDTIRQHLKAAQETATEIP